jgi:hypothetical protein
MWDNPRSIFSFLIGLVLTAFGIIPLLQQYKVISFGLPAFLNGFLGSVIMYVLAATGLYLIVQGFMEGFDSTIGKVTVVAGLVILAVGLIPLLNTFHVITFSIPFLTMTIFRVIFVIEGILLVIGSFNY